MIDPEECYLCNSKTFVYVDLLGFGWCEDHYNNYFMRDHSALNAPDEAPNLASAAKLPRLAIRLDEEVEE